jgi:hypothetical protein
MATFYVLPSRHLLGHHFSNMLQSLFPGTHFTSWDLPDLAEALAAMIEGQGDTFVVYREDLDERLSVKAALMQHFGAAFDDEIIEVTCDADQPTLLNQPWAGRRAA